MAMRETPVEASAPSTVPAPMTDRIELVLPAASRFEGVAQLVLGGVGTRCHLPYDVVDELQLAVAGVLPSARDDQVVVEIAVGPAVSVTIGPLIDGTTSDPALLHVLERLVDRVSPVSRDGTEWLALEVARPLSG
jgi:hypothetical protein